VRLGAQLRTLFFVLVGLQVVTSLAAMGLLGRMGPAIQGFIRDNERSMYAAEQMLAVIARPSVGTGDRERFMRALTAAESNVTEHAERAALDDIRTNAPAALEGDVRAKQTLTSSLVALSRINRDAMGRAHGDAQRLVLAGRWALALVALVGLLASVVSLRRARQKVLTPLIELAAVVDARRAGELYRRCHPYAETDLSRVLVAYNELLDEVDRAHAPRSTGAQTALRSALALVLDRLGGARVLLDHGELVAMSTDAMDMMSKADDALRDALRTGALEGCAERVEEVGGTTLQLVTLRSEPA
jgi:hypothetical protein